MSKKKNILVILESQIDKIVLGIIVLISLILLWMYVIGNPYGEKARIGGRETSVNPGNIDRRVKSDADKLLQDLDLPPKSSQYGVYDKTSVDDYTRKLRCTIPDIPSDLSIPYPGVGEVAVEEGRLYAIPTVPALTDVETAVLRGAARVPVDEVTPGMPYNSVETKLQDIDFVTVSARFDFQRLYNNFQLSFAGPGLKSSWKDNRLSKPVLARYELQRRVKFEDGSYSEWSTVPRAKIDVYKKLLDQLPLHSDQMQFGVDILVSQYEGEEVQYDILQPDSYLFGVSRVEWMPPEFLNETYQILEKQADQEKREAIEKRRQSRETERRTTDRGGDRRTTRRTPQTRPIAGPREMELMMTERERQTPRRTERTQQDVERDMQNAELKKGTRLDNLREPVLVWVHDDTVQPGQTYEYRVRMGVFNPITGKDWFHEDQPAFKEQTVLWSAYSEPTEEIKISKMLHVFPMDVLTQTQNDGSKTIEGVKVEVARYYMGQWQSHEFDVYPGQTIGYSVEETPDKEGMQTPDGVLMEGIGMRGNVLTGLTEETTVDYTSGLTFVDVVAQVDWGSETAPRRTSFNNMLYANIDGLSQEGIGKSNWSTLVKRAYDAIQKAMEENVEQRQDRMPGLDMEREMLEQMFMF